MEILKYPNDLLCQKCKEVKLPLSKEDSQILDEMYKTLKEHPTAVGLAAPQVGVLKRMFVIRHKDASGNTFNCKIVNPRIIPKGEKDYYVPKGEACLSEPGLQVEVKRHKFIILTGYDTISKSNVAIPLSHFRAAIAQHEMDHLNGILLHDYKENR